ncbi:MAG: hypothetical protein ACPGYF_05225 [Chitinophagales bacterium]
MRNTSVNINKLENHDIESPLYPIGTNLREKVFSKPASYDTAYVFAHKKLGKDTIFRKEFVNGGWEKYNSKEWTFDTTISFQNSDEIPAQLYLPLSDEFGMNKLVEHLHADRLTCIVVAPSFRTQDEGYWLLAEQYHEWAKNNGIQVVAYVDNSEVDPFEMQKALGLSLPINITHRDFLFPLIDSELGMIVLDYGIIIDKFTKENFPNLQTFEQKINEWRSQ